MHSPELLSPKLMFHEHGSDAAPLWGGLHSVRKIAEPTVLTRSARALRDMTIRASAFAAPAACSTMHRHLISLVAQIAAAALPAGAAQAQGVWPAGPPQAVLQSTNLVQVRDAVTGTPSPTSARLILRGGPKGARIVVAPGQ